MSRRLLAPLCVAMLAAALALPRGATEDGGRFQTSRAGARPLALPDEDVGAFTFAVFGDRTGGPPEGIAILEQAVRDANLVGPDLVMTVGDLVQGYNTTSEWLAQAAEFRGVMDRLKMPWFPVPGNHDMYWRGPGRPEREHEASYERIFGPLWYAFRHKDCWFLALFADETNPETGQKRFDDPDHQRMSPEQLEWLERTLRTTRGARHVFVFLHHPRWIGGSYGDSWDRVHELLVDAGNVTAVFAGHIHHMRYDPKDGIEYFALATVGGAQPGDLPEAGYLHQVSYVTVRDEGIAIVSYPVGAAQDPRAITGEVSEVARRAASELVARVARPAALDLERGGAVELQLELENPLPRPVEVELRPPADGDARWTFEPDHAHLELAPGAREVLFVRVERAAGPIDAAFRPARLVRAADVLFDELRVPLPDLELALPVYPAAAWAAPEEAQDRSLLLDGRADHLVVASDRLPLEDGPFTLEAWIAAKDLKGRRGIVAKTESSEFGLLAYDARPAFHVHLDGAYANAEAKTALKVGRWHHLAGVFDGREVRLYVDGELVARGDGSGRRTRNDLPLIVGGDVDRAGRATSLFAGRIDEVRLSRGARYEGARFTPERVLAADRGTLLLLPMDAEIGPWVRDASPAGIHPERRGKPRLVAAE